MLQSRKVDLSGSCSQLIDSVTKPHTSYCVNVNAQDTSMHDRGMEFSGGRHPADGVADVVLTTWLTSTGRPISGSCSVCRETMALDLKSAEVSCYSLSEILCSSSFTKY